MMRFGISGKTMARCVGAAVVQIAMGPALADSAIGPALTAGNAMNPGVLNSARDLDPAGLSPYRLPASRTPNGQLYEIPYARREIREPKSGWGGSGYIEAGVLGGDAHERNALFRQYWDVDNGFYLNNFGLEITDKARFFEIVGGGVGRSDQFYEARYGRYNDYRVDLSYSETPHVLSTTARPIWLGIGTGNLSLSSWPGVAPGGATGNNGTTAVALRELIDSTTEMELGVMRKTGSARVRVALTDAWTFHSSYTLEHRRGARPFGGNEGNGETVEPIDYKTHELNAGLRYRDRVTNFNLDLSASLFRNGIDTVSWENPFRHTSGALLIKGGRTDLYPDNDAYAAKAEYARVLPTFRNARFNATVALGAMRQNDLLVAPTVTSGMGAGSAGGFNGNFDLWNTTAALSQQRANANIDTGLVNLGLSLVPADRLTVRGSLRHYQTQNHTSYVAFNPQTGQFGYIIQDTNATTVFDGSKNVHYRNIPFQGRQDDYKLSAEYGVRRRAMLSADYEREEIQRAYRERAETWEDRVRLGYSDRGFESVTLRLAYEYGSRRGSQYISDPYKDFYTASLPAYTDTPGNVLDRLHNLEELRKYDLADRRQQVLKARLNYFPRVDVDLGATLQSKISTYPANFGRRGEQIQNSLDLDFTYLPSPLTTLNIHYSHQTSRIQQAGAADVRNAGAAGCADLPPSCSNSFGAPFSIYSADRYWSAESRDRSGLFGLGLRHDFGKTKLDMKYSYASSHSPLGYSYASANALESPAYAMQAGNAFPDVSYEQHLFDAGLRFPVSQQATIRLFYHFETGKIADFHYSGLDETTVVSNRIYLDSGPRSYRANVVGAFLQLKL